MSPRPRKGYGLTPGGKKYIGVTTPLSYFGNKNGMIYAAAKLGLDGIWYQDVWYAKRDAGTGAHTLIDAYLHGEPEPKLSEEWPPEVVEKAETAYLGFLKWADTVRFQTIETETTLYDEELGLAGTPDLAAIQGQTCIIDWKTSAAIYPETWGQIAAYQHLWNVNHPDNPVHDGYILQLNKETGGFSHHHEPSLTFYWEFYRHVLEAYRIYKEKMGGK